MANSRKNSFQSFAPIFFHVEQSSQIHCNPRKTYCTCITFSFFARLPGKTFAFWQPKTLRTVRRHRYTCIVYLGVSIIVIDVVVARHHGSSRGVPTYLAGMRGNFWPFFSPLVQYLPHCTQPDRLIQIQGDTPTTRKGKNAFVLLLFTKLCVATFYPLPTVYHLELVGAGSASAASVF